MSQGVKTIIYPVRDLAAAKARFGELLGAEPTSDSPYYVGFTIDGQDIGLDPHGHQHGATPYFHVDDVHGALKQLVDAGAEVVQDVKDVGGGRLIAAVKDPDGNVVGLLQP